MLIGSLTADSVEQLSSLERKHTCSQIRAVFPSLGMGIGARCYHHHLANRDPFGSWESHWGKTTSIALGIQNLFCRFFYSECGRYSSEARSLKLDKRIKAAKRWTRLTNTQLYNPKTTVATSKQTQKPATGGKTKCKSPSQICVSSHAKKTKTTAERGQGPVQNTTKNHQQHCGGHQPRNARKKNMQIKLIADEVQNKFVLKRAALQRGWYYNLSYNCTNISRRSLSVLSVVLVESSRYHGPAGSVRHVVSPIAQCSSHAGSKKLGACGFQPPMGGPRPPSGHKSS